MSKDLQKLHDEGIAETFRRIDKFVADTIEGLYTGSNPDAERNWADCSMKTRAALHLRKQAQDKGADDSKKVIGIVILQGRSQSAAEWEAKAAQVDSSRPAIDVEPEK